MIPSFKFENIDVFKVKPVCQKSIKPKFYGHDFLLIREYWLSLLNYGAWKMPRVVSFL